MLRIVTLRFIGTSPLLMSKGAAMLTDGGGIKPGKKKRDAAKEAELAAYRNKKGNLYFLPEAFRKSLIKRCVNQKIGKAALTGIVKGALFDLDEQCELTNAKGKPITTYEIDSRRGVNKNAGAIIIHRPRVEDWQCEASFEVDDDWITDIDKIVDVWNQAGPTIGVGAFRPECLGKFGRYKVKLVKRETSRIWD